MIDLVFTGSTGPYKAEIRVTNSLDYRPDSPADTYSVFTWHDNGEGVILWREAHDLPWFDAFTRATDWLYVMGEQ